MKTVIREGNQIVVIGAGAGGAKSALLLAQLGYRVTLLEARDKLGVPDDTKEEKINLKGISTSWINPGRAGHGFHYIDLNTGKMLLESTIGLYRQYPELPIGGMHPESHPLRKGRYFITKDSLFKKDQILAIYSQLQEHYRFLVQKDPENQVLGHPDNFFRILERHEYEKFVAVNTVDVGIETTERLIDPVLLSQLLSQRIKEEKNITLLTGKKVTQVGYGRDKAFMVYLQDGSSIAADQVINCAWENMEAIDQSLGLFDVLTKSTNRLKALAVVELPPELHDQHSMFFCMGPFCMLSNLGNGTGLMTYAPITNVANYQDSKIDAMGRRLLEGKASTEEIKHYGEGIIKGVSQWIPAIAKAKLITVRFGVVKTYGDVDIFDPRSAVHSRDYFGVDSKQICYIDNACMKLMNLDENAKLVVKLFSQHLDTELKIKALTNSIIHKMTLKFPDLLKLFLNHYSRRQFTYQDFSSEEKIEKLNSSLMTQIKNKKEIQTVFSAVPKDYPAHLMLIFLAVRKILPNVIAEVISNYCEQPKTIDHSHPVFSFWPSQFLLARVNRPLFIADDSSLKPRVKAGKNPMNRSYSYSAMIFLNPSPKGSSRTAVSHPSIGFK